MLIRTEIKLKTLSQFEDRNLLLLTFLKIVPNDLQIVALNFEPNPFIFPLNLMTIRIT